MGDFLTVLKWECQGYFVCLRLLPGQWPSQLGSHTPWTARPGPPSFIHIQLDWWSERALFPTPMKMMDISLLFANKWNRDCSLPRWDGRDNTPGFNGAMCIVEQEYHRRAENQRDVQTFVLHFSFEPFYKKETTQFFFLQLQINCLTPLIQKTNCIYTCI